MRPYCGRDGEKEGTCREGEERNGDRMKRRRKGDEGSSFRMCDGWTFSSNIQIHV